MLYRIKITQNGKKKKIVHKNNDLKNIKRKYFILKDKNKILYPRKTNAYKKTKSVKYEIILLKKYEENDTPFIDRDGLGRTIEVKDINKKSRQHIISNYSNSEIFLEEYLMINLIDHELVPEHQTLTPDEENELYNSYNCKKKNLQLILHTDPVVRYYNLKPSNIFRIIRPSMASGYGVTYRLVVKGVSRK